MQRYDLFWRGDVTPASFDRFERRIETLVRSLGRLIIQHALSKLESDERPGSFRFDKASFRVNRKTLQTLHTRLGTIRFERWYFQTSDAWYHGLAPLNVRLGVVDVRRGFTTGRLSPALADAVGRLAAEMPQQAAIEQIAG
ncbi:hypothetical protein [Rhodopirellula sp. P2]|uniref:hypothetical protein n=1 Tax=Rhodopirellula sp. P2 TaxID=2127060 RepID=UPI0023686DE4|nr:hypothetical protein [Rhodopirellula sp. P2]WDQ17886.1 hypothetical protein PSR62_04870 [Rhodopirellula sp. P2]